MRGRQMEEITALREAYARISNQLAILNVVEQTDETRSKRADLLHELDEVWDKLCSIATR